MTDAIHPARPAANAPARTAPWRLGGRLAFVAVAFWVSVRLGLLLVVQPEGIAPIWPASGVALAILLLRPRREWPLLLAVIFVVDAFANWRSGYALPVGLGFALTDVLQATLGALLLARFCPPRITFERTTEVFALLAVATVVNATTALLGATVTVLAFQGSFAEAWLVWWTSNGLGIVLIMPCIVCWAAGRRLLQTASSRLIAEAVLLILSVSVVAGLLFGAVSVTENSIVREYMLFPLLVWLAFRFTPRGVVTVLLVLSGFAVWGGLEGQGVFSFAGDELTEHIVALQIFLAAASCFSLLLCAVVSERRRAGEEVRRLNVDLERRVARRTAELENANRELESFSYSVSHDLQAPLRAMDSFSEVLLEDYADRLDDAGRHHLERIRGGARAMGLLIESLLKLSRLNRVVLERQTVDLSALAREHIATLREADPGRDVTTVVADGLRADADRVLVEALLANLLDNAWKFTSAHATARIEVGATPDEGRGAVEDEARKVEHEAGRAGDTVFFVRDDGAGFDMTYADRLFGAFQRLHSQEEFSGTGIGLATVERIVHRHGGRIWAEAEIEKGATFFFTLPE